MCASDYFSQNHIKCACSRTQCVLAFFNTNNGGFLQGDALPQSGEALQANASASGSISQEKVPSKAQGQGQGQASGNDTSAVPVALLQPGKLDSAHGRSNNTPPVSGSKLPRPVPRLTPGLGLRFNDQPTEQRRAAGPEIHNQHHRGPAISQNLAPSLSGLQPPTVSGRSVTAPAFRLRSPDPRGSNNQGKKGAKSPFLGNRP